METVTVSDFNAMNGLYPDGWCVVTTQKEREVIAKRRPRGRWIAIAGEMLAERQLSGWRPLSPKERDLLGVVDDDSKLPGWLSSTEAAEYIGLSPQRFRVLASEGLFDLARSTLLGSPRYHRDALDRAMQGDWS